MTDYTKLTAAEVLAALNNITQCVGAASLPYAEIKRRLKELERLEARQCEKTPRCETCKHWYSAVKVSGRCECPASREGYEGSDFVYSTGVSHINTGPKFGCIHYEARQIEEESTP